MSLTSQDNTIPQLMLSDGIFEQETLTAAGALTYPVGLLLGRITASGKLTHYNSGAADGSEVPVAVLTNAKVFAGAGDLVFRALLSGVIRKDQLLVWNGGTPIAPTVGELDELRDFTIIGRDTRELLKFDNS